MQERPGEPDQPQPTQSMQPIQPGQRYIPTGPPQNSRRRTNRTILIVTGSVLGLLILVGAIRSALDKNKTPATTAAAATTTAASATSATPSPTPAAAKTSPAAPITHTAPATTKAAKAPAPASPVASPSCNLPDNQDLIERDDDPQAQVLAEEVGEVDLGNCTATLDTFTQEAGQAPGECTTIAWASDNPGYDVNQIPAPPLKHVIESAGPGC